MRKLAVACCAIAVVASLVPVVQAAKSSISFMEVGDPAKIAAAKKSIDIFQKLHGKHIFRCQIFGIRHQPG